MVRIKKIRIENFGPFQNQTINIGDFSTIIGKNDAGKSFVLRALDLFFKDKPKVGLAEVHKGAGENYNVVFEVSFDSYPNTIELEPRVETTFTEEKLLDESGYIRIKKVFLKNDLTKCKTYLIVNDFVDDNFSNLTPLNEDELNEKCQQLGITVQISGRGITNRDKRREIREMANSRDIGQGIKEIQLADKHLKIIEAILPTFTLFKTDTSLEIEESAFQKEFKPIMVNVVSQNEVKTSIDVLTQNINISLQKEINELYGYFKQHCDAFACLEVDPVISWDKAFSFDLLGTDKDGIKTSLQNRGSGLKRLLMVSFFQYLAAKKAPEGCNCIFGIEEPENCLHPGLQRELIDSFNQLSRKGGQIIVTSHSPVFAGASHVDNLILLVRESGVTQAIQGSELNYSLVAEELGVEPSDQIVCYSACIFVEGLKDIYYIRRTCEILKDAGVLQHNFDDKNIGFIPIGGCDNLKCWVDLKAINKISRRFGILIDSDRENSTQSIDQRKLDWKSKCEEQHGVFFITKKRELENYLHSNVINRIRHRTDSFDDFTDMKTTFGDNVYKVVDNMSSTEILERDRYEESGAEHHELLEILRQFLNLSVTH